MRPLLQISYRKTASKTPNHIRLFRCIGINGIKWDEMGLKLNINDSWQILCTHMHILVFSHTITQTQAVGKKNPPEILSHLLSLKVDKSFNFWQAWKTLCLQIPYLNNLVEIWHNLSFRWETKLKTQRSCCAETDWPTSQQQLGLALSTISNSPWPQQQSGKLGGIVPRRKTERSEKLAKFYQSPEIMRLNRTSGSVSSCLHGYCCGNTDDFSPSCTFYPAKDLDCIPSTIKSK